MASRNIVSALFRPNFFLFVLLVSYHTVFLVQFEINLHLYFFQKVEIALAEAARAICNGNRTEWSPIRSVIIRVITKSDDRAAGVRFVYHEYDYRQNWTTRSLITN